MRNHPRRTHVDPSRPAAWGTCDRSGFVLQHRDMRWQHEWRGASIVNTRVLVAPDMLDLPQRQLGVFVLPPDPVPIQNARPERYSIDEEPVSTRVTVNGSIRIISGQSAANISERIVAVQGNL